MFAKCLQMEIVTIFNIDFEQ